MSEWPQHNFAYAFLPHTANEQGELLIKQGLSDCVHASYVNVRCAILQCVRFIYNISVIITILHVIA